jgi:FkbM family methyltransferase
MTERLEALGLGMPYRIAATSAAGLLFRVPALEAPFVAASRRFWRAPVVGRPIRSVAYRFADRLRGTGREYRRVSVAGTAVSFDASHWSATDTYFAGEEYEPATCAYLARYLFPGDVFVDVGANAGIMTILAAARVGAAGRVYAFEPNPAVVAELERHISVNGFGDRVRTLRFALSNADGRAALHVTPVMSGLSSIAAEAAPAASALRASGQAIDVETRRFDGWMRAAGLDRVDVMKIDVEGAEELVLAGMTDALTSGVIRRLVCELRPDGPAHELLRRFGYRPEPLESYGPVGNVAYTRS